MPERVLMTYVHVANNLQKCLTDVVNCIRHSADLTAPTTAGVSLFGGVEGLKF